jgi:hypothetical protein
MEQSNGLFSDLFVTLIILNQPLVEFWIYNCDFKERANFRLCPYYKLSHQIHKDNDPALQYHILIILAGTGHISDLYARSLSFDILDK